MAWRSAKTGSDEALAALDAPILSPYLRIRNSVFPVIILGAAGVIPLDPLPNLIDQVYARILEAISDRTLQPGQRIRQNELAYRLGVSRQPVSHALHLLHRQGLVAESGRRGFEVTQLDPARIRQLYEVRGAIDALAARLAGERAASDAAGRAPPGGAGGRGGGGPRAAGGGARGRARDRWQDHARRADRARRRVSSRDLSARRQSRDRGDDYSAMAAYAPLDGDGAVRTRLSRQRLGRACRHRRTHSRGRCQAGRTCGACARADGWTDDRGEIEGDGRGGGVAATTAKDVDGRVKPGNDER